MHVDPTVGRFRIQHPTTHQEQRRLNDRIDVFFAESLYFCLVMFLWWPSS